MELDDAAEQLVGADDGGDAKLVEAVDQAGAFTDARLTELLAAQARDDVCKQVAAKLQEQPDGRLNEQRATRRAPRPTCTATRRTCRAC